jgi:hypothetical protein
MAVLNLDTEPADFYYLDLFPAAVYVGGPDGTLIGEELRVIVTDNHFYVFHEVGTGPETLIKDPLVAFEGTHRTGYTVTATNNNYYVKRAANCGCGSRLRGVIIFPGLAHTSHLPPKK